MRKIKCDVCSHWHGGFHLCVGPNANPELKKHDTTYAPANQPKMSKAEAAKERWKIAHAKTLERDTLMLERHKAGKSYRAIGAEFGISHTVAMSIVNRMKENA